MNELSGLTQEITHQKAISVKMKALCLVVVLLALPVLRSESHPRHRNSTNLETQVGQKRVIKVIVTAFNSFNKIADFTERCNTVVGWLDNINLFMGSGGTQGESVVTSQLLDSIKGDIENLATKVEDDFKDILAGQEYAQILATMSTHLGTLRIINNLQKEYLDAAKSYKETAPAARNKKLMIQIRQKWFDDVDKRFVALKNALVILHENICDPILNSYDLFEGYAWRKSQQGTGTLVDLMNFISKIRTLEANVFGVWKSHILKKYENDEDRRTMELKSVQAKMENVAKRENLAIARSFTSMTDYQGTPAFGRIRWTHTFENTIGYDYLGNPIKKKSDRCLTYMGGVEAIPFARECSNSENQQWKLYADNTLRPKNDINKCLFLMEPAEEAFSPSDDYKLLPCSSSYGNKKFTFEYLTQEESNEPKIHTFFKLKVKNNGPGRDSCQNQNIYLVYRPRMEGWEGTALEDLSPSMFSCPCPDSGPDAHNCLNDTYSKPGWFTFEPVSE